MDQPNAEQYEQNDELPRHSLTQKQPPQWLHRINNHFKYIKSNEMLHNESNGI